METNEAVEHDLTPKVALHTDPHMTLMIMEHLSEMPGGNYDRQSLLKAKEDTLSKTKMLDYYKEVLEQQNEPPANYEADIEARKEEVIKELKEKKEPMQELDEIFNDREFQMQAKQMRNSAQILEYLTAHHNISERIVDDVYAYAKFSYEIGDYQECFDWLGKFIQLAPPNHAHALDAIWGRLASAICSEQYDQAHESMTQLRENIDQSAGRDGSPGALQLLQQRTWLLHWSLFIFFNGLQRGKELLIELFLHNPDYTHAVQTMAPWLLRYLTAAVVLSINSRKRKSIERDLVKVIEQEEYAYKDPVTEFILCLYVKFDFRKAQEMLEKCTTVLENDFFLRNYTEQFIENARQIIFETFCRIHQCISIEMLAEKLNMNTNDAESWIVNLIKNARLDAKIDSRRGHVVMSDQATNPHQQVIDKTKNLQFRSSLLSTFIDRRMGKEKGSDVPTWAMRDSKNSDTGRGGSSGWRR